MPYPIVSTVPLPLLLLLLLLLLSPSPFLDLVSAGYLQGDESSYLTNFDAAIASSYSAVDDVSVAPPDLLVSCKDGGNVSPVTGTLPEVIVAADDGGGGGGGGGGGFSVSAASVQSQCGSDSTCVIPAGMRLVMEASLNVAALIVRGELLWRDVDQLAASQHLCAGYVAVEEHGRLVIDLQEEDEDGGKEGWVYLKDNGMVHPILRARGFGGAVPHDNAFDHSPVVHITGRQMDRTWSLLADPFEVGQSSLKLLHSPVRMGWRVGDRIGIASTRRSSGGTAQSFKIASISDDGSVGLAGSAADDYAADFLAGGGSASSAAAAALMSAEVINLSRNVVITGDDLTQVPCDPNLPEAVPGEQTSTAGCRCSSFRSTCTVGLHTAQMHGGIAKIKNVRVEKCGQRGIEGKYCLHFHKLQDCPGCAFENNAIEYGHQRGIIVHGTHRSTVSNNVLFDVRGAGIYIEDGNEMWNSIKYNVIVCPWPLNDRTMHGCTIPGTSNDQADTSVNQAAIYTVTATNDLIGNRASNSFNGMLLQANGIGRGEVYGKVCTGHVRFGRWEGNTFHGHGRFGTYSLDGSLPRETDADFANNGYNTDKATCGAFDGEGEDRGAPVSILNNVDYGNVFVGHYTAGDMQHRGHKSIDNNNLIYWKETKNFPDGCGAHLADAVYSNGNMALPDESTFIIQDSILDGVTLEANHHCNIGTTGFLCMPQYVLHNVKFRNGRSGGSWIYLQTGGTGGGGVFTLSPPSAADALAGVDDDQIFPPGFVSLASGHYIYLLNTPDDLCIMASSLGQEYATRYDNGIICKVPLRVIKIWSKNLASATAPGLFVEAWADGLGITSQDTNPPTSSQTVNYHSIGDQDLEGKQGYSFPVIPMPELVSYRLSLMAGDGTIPADWIIEFSDPVVGNRWGEEFVQIAIKGRDCGVDGLLSSHHDRRYMAALQKGEEAWGYHGACLGGAQSPDMPIVDCGTSEGAIAETECPYLCPTSCDPSISFCHCGTGTCQCKPGFAGADCSIDLCAAARCGEHGTCSARYLGDSSALPVTSAQNACICDEGWFGPLCENPDPCLGSDLTCRGRGHCEFNGYVAYCKCDSGYSGENCEDSCDGICAGGGGIWPYGCSTNIGGAVKYKCGATGGCEYLEEGQDGTSTWCIYKDDSQQTTTCKCPSENDCETKRRCNPDGTCPDPTQVADGTPCNSKPFGLCQGGVCLEPQSSITETPSRAPTTPTSPPIIKPTASPTPNPPTGTPTPNPTENPTLVPTVDLASPCGCSTCTQDILKRIVCDGGGCFSCGSRIDWLMSPDGGSNSEYYSCTLVAEAEFPDVCGPCNPNTDAPTKTPTAAPTTATIVVPTKAPTVALSTQFSCADVCDGGGPHFRCAWWQMEGKETYQCHGGACQYLGEGEEVNPAWCTYMTFAS